MYTTLKDNLFHEEIDEETSENLNSKAAQMEFEIFNKSKAPSTYTHNASLKVILLTRSKFFSNFNRKSVVYPVFLCGESIARIPEACKCFLCTDLGWGSWCIEAKIEKNQLLQETDFP